VSPPKKGYGTDIELANTFSVSTDYILGVERDSAVDVSGLSSNEVAIVVEVIEGFRGNRKASS
jgi:hypothetical protein